MGLVETGGRVRQARFHDDVGFFLQLPACRVAGKFQINVWQQKLADTGIRFSGNTKIATVSNFFSFSKRKRFGSLFNVYKTVLCKSLKRYYLELL